jgi:hypothetical protein
MINKKRLLENLQARPQAILEYTMGALANMSDDDRKNRSAGMTGKFVRVSLGADKKSTWLHWNVPSESTSGKNYEVIVELDVPADGGFFKVAKEKARIGKKIQTLGKSDVKVYCNCPDFYWAGQKYNLGSNGKYGKEHQSTVPLSNGYKYEKGTVSHAPDKRDPNREHVLCKHILIVAKLMPSNAASIFAKANAYNVDDADNPQLASDASTGDFVEAPKGMTADTVDVMQDVATMIASDVNQGSAELLRQTNDASDETIETEPIDEPISTDPDAVTSEEGTEELVDEMNQQDTDSNLPPAPNDILDDKKKPTSPISDDGVESLVNEVSDANRDETELDDSDDEITIPS